MCPDFQFMGVAMETNFLFKIIWPKDLCFSSKLCKLSQVFFLRHWFLQKNMDNYLVGGAITILKNMKVNGKDDIPYSMENEKCLKPPTSYASSSQHVVVFGQSMLGSLWHTFYHISMGNLPAPSNLKSNEWWSLNKMKVSLVGGIPTPLKNMTHRQLGWFSIPNIMRKS